MDELERILTDDPVIRPTFGFSTRVMRAVREEAARIEPLPFPWARFLPGFGLSLVLCLVAGVGFLDEVTSSAAASTPWTVPVALAEPQVQALLWVLVSLAGVFALVWGFLGWSTPRRTISF